ncbi:MAG TPA: 50S ribosomal protein L22 [Candidatus Moranbacteria bacterium]|nr:50S ribosomal protein L22 [Candidatus Moranbacteria bacterium]HRZ33381.1 50S ribosomal protein L22 [Candidatus Moranbacteria bacterium]
MKVKATLKNLRISPRKVRLVTGSIIGMDSNSALVQLKHVVKKTSGILEKLLISALANAENNFGLDRDNMFVSNITVEEGSRLKRWLPRAQGRATLILKRTCHIKMEIEERVEGKNRKSKQQLEKERAKREAEKKKILEENEKRLEKEEKERQNEEIKSTEKSSAEKMLPKSETVKKGQEKGFLKKVFQRKSV